MSLSIYLTQGARNEGSLSRLGVCELPRCFTTIRALLNHELAIFAFADRGLHRNSGKSSKSSLASVLVFKVGV